MSNKSAEFLYISLQMRIDGYQKEVDNIYNSLSFRNDYSNMITGMVIAQNDLLKEFKLNLTKLKEKMENIRNGNPTVPKSK